MPKDGCKATLLNHTLQWVFFCKFAAYLWNTFSYEQLGTTASGFRKILNFDTN